MNRFWSAVVRELTPYVPGEQPRLQNLIKLNTNENPYGPSPRALDALRAEATDTLRLYPDPESTRLRESVAARYDVAVEQVFVGNGSDEVLAHTFQALLKHEAPVLFPDVTYSFYPVYCRLYGIDYREIPLTESLEVDIRDFRSLNGGVILPNPNAPTGRLLDLVRIEELLRANPNSVVVIDEAYVDFGGVSAIPLVSRYPNLLVTRTLSKSHSLAGLRVGFAIGDAGLVEALSRVKDSFNSYPIDRLAQAGAAAALEDRMHAERTCACIVASRNRLERGLLDLDFDVVPSAANFLFCRHPFREGAELSAALRNRGIVVRHFRAPGRISAYLRITVGTDAQCEALLSALTGILA